MKSLLIIGVVSLFLFSCGSKVSSTNQDNIITSTSTTQESFETLAYNKQKNKDRHFIIYTTITDKDKLIEHARKQAWTERQLTYVTFVNSKENTKFKDITLFEDFERGILLEGVFSDTSIILGTYLKSPNGNEFWIDKDGFIDSKGEEIQIK